MTDSFDDPSLDTPAQRLGASAELAKGANYDVEAELRRAAKIIGVPEESARTDPEYAKREAQYADFDPADYAKRHPGATRFLIDNASVALDDHANLGRLEAAQQSRGRIPVPTETVQKGVADKALDLFGEFFLRPVGGDLVGTINTGAAWALAGATGVAADVVEPLSGTLLPENPLRRAQQFFNEREQSARQWQQSYGVQAGSLKDPVSQAIASVPTSIGLSILSAPVIAEQAAVTTPGAVLQLWNTLRGVAPIGAITGAQAGSDAKAAGKSGLEQLVYATEQGGAEALTEMLPFGKVLEDIRADTPLFKMLGKQLVTENLSEQAATAWQDMNEWLTLHPEKSADDYLAERPNAALQTLIATSLATTVQTTAFKSVATAAERAQSREQERAQKAQAEVKHLTELMAAASKSKLRERDPEGFAQLVNQLADEHGAPTEFYLDAGAVMKALEGADEEALNLIDQRAPSLGRELLGAMDTGGTVRIPVGELTAAFAGTPLEQTLVPHAKANPEDLSLAEAQAQDEQAAELLQQEAQKVLGKQKDQKAWTKSVAAVEGKVFDMLQGAGRYSPDVNRQQAKLYGAFYATAADKWGVTPERLFEMFPLQGVRANTPGGQTAPAADTLVDQPGYNAEEVDFLRREGLLSDQEAGTLLANDKRGDRNGNAASTRGPAAAGSPVQAQQNLLATVGGRPAAQGWVGATRVRRADGKPATVFRGASRGLSAGSFAPERLGHASGNPSGGLGVWFTPHQEEAAGYGNAEAFYLDLRNPKVIKVEDLPSFDSKEAAQQFAQDLQAQGYDGLAVEARHVGGPVHFVAFNPDSVIPKPAEGETFAQVLRREGEAQAEAADALNRLVQPNPATIFEVAPDPDNLELNARWMALPFETRQEISAVIAEQIAPSARRSVGLSASAVEMKNQVGGFEGNTNPSFALLVQEDAIGQSPEKLIALAKLLGYALNQNSVVVASNSALPGLEPVEGVVFELNGADPDAVYQTLRALKNEKGGDLVSGFTYADGRMTVLNFSGLDSLAFAQKIDEVTNGAYEISVYSGHSTLIEKDNYGHGSNGSPKIDRFGKPVLGYADQLRAEANAALEQAVGEAERGEWRAPERVVEHLRVNTHWTPRVYRNGPAAPGANPPGETIVTVHYSDKPRDILDGAFHGTGYRGAERQYTMGAEDRRVSQRVYGYIDQGMGVQREIGVGGVPHFVVMRNLYDLEKDPLGLRVNQHPADLDSDIMDAGYDGYFRRDVLSANGHKQGAAVVFGPASRSMPTYNSKDEADDAARQDPERPYEQSASIRAGRETLKKYGLQPGKKYTTRQVAAALEARQRARYGSIDRNDRSPEAAKKIAKWMVEEVQFEMQHPEKSGVGWYSEKFQRALDTFAQEFPELAHDQDARSVLTALIAITSDGQKVVPNFQQAVDLYASYRNGGKFSTTRGHIRQGSIDGNVAKLQELIDKLGPAAAREYLLREITVSELNRIARKEGLDVKTDYQAHITLPAAALVFGPKLGAFYANLMGSHGYLTMDRWWSRTFNRYRGELLQAPTRAGLDRFKELLGDPSLSDDEAIAATVEHRKSYEAKNFKNGTEIEKAANTIWKAAFLELEDAPWNATDRTFMLNAVNEAHKMLKRRGVEMSIADIQAVLWYYEKRLYGELGARQSADVSYEEAAQRVIASRAGGSAGSAAASGEQSAAAQGAEAPAPGEEAFNEDELNQTWYYSPLQRAVEGLKQNIAPASQWLGMIKPGKLPGVKTAELEATGLLEWLQLAGDEKLTRDQIMDFLNDRAVRVEEVMKGAAKVYVVTGAFGGKFTSFEAAEQHVKDVQLLAENSPAIKKKLENFPLGIIAQEGQDTKFGSYVTPGESEAGSYRELLITLPQKRGAPDGQIDLSWNDNNYKSSHWQEANVAVHVRLNARTDVDGKRVLFIEEIQSDWGQQGKRDGFKQKLTPEHIAAAKEELKKNIDERDSIRARYSSTEDGETLIDKAEAGDVQAVEDRARLRELAMRASVLRAEIDYGSLDKGVPTAPFVTNTEAWVSLALKRAIRYAAENGFDRVAISNGDQNVAKYPSLETVVGQIEITPITNKGKFADIYNVSFQNDVGIPLSSEDESGRTMTKSELEATIGVEATHKLLAGLADANKDSDPADVMSLETFSLAGEGLKTGGEGMRAFYDKVVPSVAKKVLKELKGPALGVTKVDTSTTTNTGKLEYSGPEVTRELLARMISREQDTGLRLQFERADEILASGGDYTRAIEEMSEAAVNRFGGTWGDRVGGATDQLSFDVTPELRDTAMAGLPLFQRTEARGTFNPSTFEISLLEKADLSTFLHETGHFFMEVYGRMAAHPDAPQQIKDDMDALLKWGAAPGDTPAARLAWWISAPVSARRELHESWAETFEQYLFNGKAPSIEMRGLFQRFSGWLKNVYRTLQDMLKQNRRADLDPEVQGVMDRMLATDEQIQQAESARAATPMFASAEEAKMSPAEWESYQQLQAQAAESANDELRSRSLRDMKWIGNARSKVLKGLQKDVIEKRKAVRREIEAEVMARPVYKAIEFLKRGLLPEENRNSKQRRVLEDIGMTGQHKLDLGALKAMYGDAANAIWRFLPNGKYGYTAQEGNGLAPDLVADLTGFPSGDALVREILAAPPAKEVIDQLTDQAMLERYGDLTSPEAMSQAADEAIHNAARARMVATELTALQRLAGGPRLALQMAKEFATRALGERKLRDLRPRQAAADAAKAGRDADKALKAGKTAEAAKLKRNQLLHLETTKATYEAQREIEKAIAQFKTIFAPNSRLAKTRNMDVVNAARAVLSAYGFGPKGMNPQEHLAQVQQYDPELYADLVSIMGALPPGVEDHKDLTVDQFRAMRDTVQSLWHLSRRSKQVEIDGQLVEVDAIADEIVGRVEELSGGELPPLPGYASTTTRADEFKIGALGLRSALTRVESWADRMGPAFTRFIFNPISEAVTRYRAARNDMVAKYLELLHAIEPGLTFTKISAPELNGFTFNGGKSEILHALLHTGNDSNKRKLLLGRGWATENSDGTLNTAGWDAFVARLAKEGALTEKDFDFVQGVWDLLESTKVDAQRAHKALYGYYFDEITANEFVDPWGNKRRGGYVPAVSDVLSSPDQAQKREAEELLHAGNSFMFPTTGRGFTKSRVEYNRPLELDLRVLASHLDKVMRFVHIEPAVKDVGRLLINKRIARALNGYDQTAISQMLNPWLQRTARQTVSVPGKNRTVDKFWNGLRKRAGMQTMVANVINTLQQITGITIATVRIPAPAMLRSLKHYMAAPRETAAQVAALSPWMKDRMESQSFEMTAAIEDLLINPNVYEKSKSYLERNGYFMQQAMQNVVDVVTWMGSYQNAVKNGLSQQDAVRAADADVRLTQSSFAPEDISSFEANTPFVRLFTQFTGYFNMLANTLGSEGYKAVRDMGFKDATGRLAWIWFAGLAMPAFLSALMAQGAPDDKDDEDGDGLLDEWLAMFFGSQGRTLAAMLPGVGQGAQLTANLLDDKRYNDRLSISPALSMTEAGARTAAALAKGELFDEHVKKTEVRDALTLIGMLTGLPTGAAARPAGYATDLANGKAQPDNAAEVAKGLVVGR